MPKIISLIFFLLFLFPQSITNIAKTNENFLSGSTHFYSKREFKNYFFTKILQEKSFSHFLEIFYEDVTVADETIGNFNKIDPLLFSLGGNSWQWNSYTFNGVKINDPFFSGTSLFYMDLKNKNLKINMLNSKINFSSVPFNFTNGNKIFSLQHNNGTLWDKFIYSEELTKLFGGHTAPQERKFSPPTERRKINGETEINFSTAFQLTNQLLNFLNIFFPKNWQFNSKFFFGERKFLDYNYDGFKNTFDEEYFYGQIQILNFDDSAKSDFGFLLDYKYRDKFFAERRYHEQETATLKQLNMTIYQKWLSQKIITSLDFGFKTVHQNNTNRSRNIFDITGEGIEPYYPSAVICYINSHNRFDFSLPFDLKLHSELNNQFLSVAPFLESQQIPHYYRDREKKFSLYVSSTESKNFLYDLFQQQSKIKKQIDFWIFSTEISAGWDVNGFWIQNDESLISFSPNFHGEFFFVKNNSKQVSFSIGRENPAYGSEYVLFLADNYYSMKNYLWEDKNNNQTAEQEEISKTLHSTSGSAYHQLAKNFKQPHFYYFSMPTKFKINQQWQFSSHLYYKTYRDMPWVSLDEKTKKLLKKVATVDADERGNDEVTVLEHGERNYILGNFPQNQFSALKGGLLNFLADHPFILNLAIKFSYTMPKFFFSFSFRAYAVNGLSHYGNGVYYSHIGAFSEQSAQPNNEYKSVGRYAHDRSYMGKMIFSYLIDEKNSFALSIRYKDGEPFGSWNTYTDEENNQVTFYRHYENADIAALTGINRLGKRKDAHWNFDFTFRYQFEKEQSHFFVKLYNFFDLAAELMEWTLYDKETASRSSLELQIPSGIMIGFQIVLF